MIKLNRFGLGIFILGIVFASCFVVAQGMQNLAEGSTEINGNLFENIQPSSKTGLPSFVELDENGNVIRADFTTNEKGGTYTLGGVTFKVGPNKRVHYKDGVLELSEGGEIIGIPKSTVITGGNILLPNGNVMNAGTLNYDETGQAFVSYEHQRNTVRINNVDISNPGEIYKKNVNVFFDGEKHEGISFGKKKLLITSTETEGGKSSQLIEFREGNPYLKVDGKKYAAIRPIANTEIEIDSSGAVPVVTATPKVSGKSQTLTIYEGARSINYLNNEVRIRRPILREETRTTSPMKLIIWGEEKQHHFMIDSNTIKPVSADGRISYDYVMDTMNWEVVPEEYQKFSGGREMYAQADTGEQEEIIEEQEEKTPIQRLKEKIKQKIKEYICGENEKNILCTITRSEGEEEQLKCVEPNDPACNQG